MQGPPKTGGRTERRAAVKHRAAERKKTLKFTDREKEAIEAACDRATRTSAPPATRTSAPPATLSELSHELPYRPDYPTQLLTSQHFGQRKLLMSEVDFLTRQGHLSDNVVYAGAAPGEHIPFLAELFPGHRFILYDPAPFRVKASSPLARRIEIHREYFTDEVAEKLAKKYKGDLLFISDIRAVDPEMTHEEFEARVDKDQEWQRGWVETLQPWAALLKFRVPFEGYEDKPYEYLAGEVRLQVWAPRTSAETRLEVVRGSTASYETESYETARYEAKLFWQNVVGRDWVNYEPWIEEQAPGLLEEVPGLDASYDSAREVAIWLAYCDATAGDDVREAARGVVAHPHRAAHLEKRAYFVAELMEKATQYTKQPLDRMPHGRRRGEHACGRRAEILVAGAKKILSSAQNKPKTYHG